MTEEKVKHLGKCSLCLEEKQLCKSHILPEFLYSSLYDHEHHRFTQIPFDADKRVVKRPTGLYERLLCENCDNIILGKLESYAKQLLFGGIEIRTRSLKRFFIVSSIEYSTFKLFLISIMWRMGVSKRSEFSEINLLNHGEKMRKMILNNDPREPHKYGCIAIYTPSNRDIWDNLIMLPEEVRFDGHRCYRLLFAGIYWVMIVSSHSHQLSSQNIFLNKNGELPVFIEDKFSKRFLFESAMDLKNKGKLSV